MEIISEVTEKFFDFLEGYPFPISTKANGMGIDYFDKETGRLIGNWTNGTFLHQYFLIDYFDDPPRKTSYGIY